MPDVIAMQDIRMYVKFRSYSTYHVDPSTCILVHKQCMASTTDLALDRDVEHTIAQIFPTRHVSKTTATY